jgi:2-polyprenyl-3-methyl-5-hydroxy-6-metoxy-1,4-benzoquinol methylase
MAESAWKVEPIEEKGMNCHICGNEKMELFLNTPEGDYLRCLNCEVVQHSSIPNKSDIKKVYSREYFTKKKNGMGADFLGEEKLYSERFGDRLKRIEKKIKKGRILDIGASVGHFLFGAKQNGWDVSGVEISKDAVEMAKQRYRLHITVGTIDDINIEKGLFDVVTLWHVFEHFPAPVGSLSRINDVLKDEGLLVLELPNIDSKEAKRDGITWSFLMPAEHFFHYAPKSISILLESNGFKIENIEYTTGGTGIGEKMEKLNINGLKNLLLKIFPPVRWLRSFLLKTLTAHGSEEIMIVFARKMQQNP